jgi:cyclase
MRTSLVSTVSYSESIVVGDPVSQAKIYESQAADELILLDLDATSEGRPTDASVVERLAEEIFMPFTIGGGVKAVSDFKRLLDSGADKVSINTAAVQDPDLIKYASDQFGAQCVVVSIDYRVKADGSYRVYVNSGTVETELDPVDWAHQVEQLGAGEILLTSIDRDGSRHGLDLELTRRVVDHVSIPVITSGGCGAAKHFIEGFAYGGADAVAAGTYFAFRDENPMQTRSQIKNAGIPIRIHR